MPVDLNIAHEEERDLLDPLRHLMQDADFDADPASIIMPPQLPSIHDILHFSFSDLDDDPPITISLAVDPSPGCGGIAWPAGQVLANYLVKKGPEFLRDRSILELGSGTGLVGLVAGKLGGNVWITDQTPLLKIMRQNVKLNNLSSRITVSELNWGSPIPIDIPHPQLVIAADCVYFEPAFPLLVQTLSDLVGLDTEVLFCYKKRRKADRRFFAMLKKQFTWMEVMDDPDRESYIRESITLLRLSKSIPRPEPLQRNSIAN